NIHRFAAVITFGYFFFHLLTLIQLKAKAGVSFNEFMFGKNSLMFSLQDLKDFGASVKWFPPTEEGTYDIYCKIIDERGGAAFVYCLLFWLLIRFPRRLCRSRSCLFL
ncbi:MAG: hypothetical protein P8X52_03910, partial [Limibacillus sp.]